MKTPVILLSGLLLTMLAVTPAVTANPNSAAHAHVGHVLIGWKDTPGGVGLISIAEEEARVARFHAQLATEQTDNLQWMQTHTRHVVHAIDPSRESDGPGKGYGVLRAANGVAKHIRLAADSADASAVVKTHALHIATSADNVVSRAQTVLDLAEQVAAGQSAEAVAPLVTRIEQLTGKIIDGVDADQDGAITWQAGEGGLRHSRKHLDLLVAGEGL